MAKRDQVSTEDRSQFEAWGIKRVREMIARGHYSAEQRRPMSVWIAEQDSKTTKKFVLLTTALGLVILCVVIIGVVGT
jgi:hypothetical protein